MKLWYLTLLCAMPVQAVAACMFTSNLAPFQADTSTLVDNPAIPAPEVESSRVIRGTGGGASCDAMGFMSLAIKWPRGSQYGLEDVGFEYRVVSGDAPDGMIPAGVLVSPVSGRKAEHQFAWQDPPPSEQRPVHFVLEVRAVTRDHQRGAPAQVVVGR